MFTFQLHESLSMQELISYLLHPSACFFVACIDFSNAVVQPCPEVRSFHKKDQGEKFYTCSVSMLHQAALTFISEPCCPKLCTFFMHYCQN